MVNLIVKLVDYITPFHLFGTQVAIDRKESQNIAVNYFTVNADWLLYPFLIGFTRI